MSGHQSIAEIVANSVAGEANDCNDDDEHEPQDSVELAVELADPSFADTVTALDLLHRWMHQNTYQRHLKKVLNPAAEEAARTVFADAVEAVKET
ncbi:hypothetical protein HPB50_024164 [Hyalomma asiaticum]|uniref:Uncharacterized protein n=1 Tax=Hyalomma asiaticum TaxID=266040 RepID=A0ACB7SP17_HYAAI|nr:hypothetical protein HPB50_024164 [Hyalomma asiaticum]